MKKTILLSALGVVAASSATVAGAQEVGRVISSTPVIQQVAVPRQACNSQPVAVQPPSSGGGAVVGAIVGGLLGNTIGHGMGRAAATGAGVLAGAAVGDSVENRQPVYAQQQQCTTQTYYENRTVGYNVQYEYGGKQYSVQMPYDPGPTIRVQVTPVSGTAPADSVQPVASGTPAGVILAEQPAVAYPAYPAYPVYPAYYRPYYYPPVGISLGFGFYGGHHHHWR